MTTAQSWEEAKNLAALIGQLPASFASCIHFLRLDSEQRNGELGTSSSFELTRLLKSASLLSPLYFAARTYFPESVKKAPTLNTRTLISLFRADELAMFLTLLYLQRRIKRGCDTDEWKYIENSLVPSVDLGGALGQAMPTIGMSLGMALGGIRHLTLGLFLGVKKEGFIKYRRELKSKNIFFDIEQEEVLFGCNHLQVSGFLFQSLGIGAEIGSAISAGLDPTLTEAKDKALAVKIGAVWLESLIRHGTPPDIAHRVQFYPKKEDLDWLTDFARKLRDSGSENRWILRGKDDISPQKTPALFSTAASAPATPEEIAPDIAAIEEE